MTFLDFAQKVLEHQNSPMKAGDIWKNGVELGFDKELGSKGRTPWETLGARLYTNVRDDKDSIFASEGKNPQKFYLKNKDKVQEQTLFSSDETKTKSENKSKYTEKDLHPLLTKFLDSNPHFKCKSKTIDDKKSKKERQGSNEWLHPDIVGVYLPSESFEQATLELQKVLSQTSIKLFSFELKLELNMSNIREYFFQSVSNSSWANEGYLVALKIEEDEDFRDELRRLNNSFGIGIIALNPELIEQSEILFYSKSKSILDWETIDRLCSKNPDFQDFIATIVDGHKGKFDKVLSDEEYNNHCKAKKLIQ